MTRSWFFLYYSHFPYLYIQSDLFFIRDIILGQLAEKPARKSFL